MSQFLKAPYPFFHVGRELLVNCILIIALGFFFDYFFEPFNVVRSEHKLPYWGIVLAHAGGASVIYGFCSLMASKIVNQDKWKLGKEFTFLAICMLIIGIANYFWRPVIYDNPNNASWNYFWEEILHTFLVGSLILFIITTINFRWLDFRNRRDAGKLHTAHKTLPDADQTNIKIQSQVTADDFEFNPHQLLCVKADGNYVEFHLKQGNEVDRRIVRLSLNSAYEQLSDLTYIIKTHRAYLVNKNHIAKAEGNAQGYLLTLDQLGFQVPVSRSNLSTVRSSFD
ncbi:MAG: LytTR family transcriptional regulator [Cytophagia bacterium]|nr:LytTR family transcriptional regulator [Cytophagia bacterium]